MKFKFEVTLEKSVPTAGPNCGSLKGAYAHTKRKETSCQDCLAARASYTKAYKLANKEKVMLDSPRWNKDNRDKAQILHRQRKALKFKVESEPYTSQEIIDLYGTDCYLCRGPIAIHAGRKVGSYEWEKSLHLYHVVAMSKGGPDLKENIRPVHGKCGMRDHN